MEWFEVEAPTGKRIPIWMRSAGIKEDGTVFIPGAIAGTEMEIILCASYDGTPVVHYLDHAYFPSKWMMKEFPDVAELCEKIEKSVTETFMTEREN